MAPSSAVELPLVLLQAKSRPQSALKASRAAALSRPGGETFASTRPTTLQQPRVATERRALPRSPALSNLRPAGALPSGRFGRGGKSAATAERVIEPGHASLLPWAWRAVSLPQASEASLGSTDYGFVRRVTMSSSRAVPD
jgi:hypothetical protein